MRLGSGVSTAGESASSERIQADFEANHSSVMGSSALQCSRDLQETSEAPTRSSGHNDRRTMSEIRAQPRPAASGHRRHTALLVDLLGDDSPVVVAEVRAELDRLGRAGEPALRQSATIWSFDLPVVFS